MKSNIDDYKVYIHKFPNNKVYIGITLQKPEYRWRKGNKYKGNEYITNAINPICKYSNSLLIKQEKPQFISHF